MKCKSTKRALATLLALAALGGASAASAATTGGTLPWEAPLRLIVTSMTGPVAFSVSVIALVMGISTLAFSDQLSGAGRYMVYFVLIIAMLVAVVNLLQTLFGAGANGGGSLGTMQIGVAVTAIVAAAVLALLQLALARCLTRAWTVRRELAPI